MDKLKSFASDPGNIKDQLKDLHFPASKDEICSQLEQKGVPQMVIDKVKNADVSQFNSVDDVLSKVKSL